MVAPTAELILRADASFSINCDGCRLLMTPPDLAARLCAAGKGAIPVDQLRFRCQRCGNLGEPWVTGPGNMLIGREQLWPPQGMTMADKVVTITLTVPEARALLKAAETGVSVIVALNLIQAMGLTESAVTKLRSALPAR